MKAKKDVERAYQLLVEYQPETERGRLIKSASMDVLLWALEEFSILGELLDSWETVEEQAE